MKKYYDEKYFNDYQKKIGEFGGIANLFKFKKFIRPSDAILDFGCGGGFLLKNLNAKSKQGVEINPFARNYCKNELKIECFESIDEINENSIDVIISNHALEHTTNPYKIILNLYTKLKKGGIIVFVVPLDHYKFKYDENDVNKHLFSFSPMNLGNIFSACGFKIKETGTIFHKWPPFYYLIKQIFGWNFFHLLARIYGRLSFLWTQTYVVAIKEN